MIYPRGGGTIFFSWRNWDKKVLRGVKHSSHGYDLSMGRVFFLMVTLGIKKMKGG